MEKGMMASECDERHLETYGVEALLALLSAGLVGDLLLREVPYGLNLAAWLALVILGGAGLARRHGAPVRGWLGGLCFAAVVFAGCVGYRDSALLKTAALACWVLAFCGAAATRSAFEPLRAGLARWIAMLGRGLSALLGTALPGALRHVPVHRMGASAMRRRMVAAGRGLLLAAPVLLVFGLLLMSADRVFVEIARRLLDFDFSEVAKHIAVFALSGWVGAATVVAVARGAQSRARRQFPDCGPRIGGIEASVVMGAVNLLFLAFVAVQVRYFFGGEATIRAFPNLSYSAYARQGFFELCAVSALAFILQYGMTWLIRGAGEREKLVVRFLSVGQIALVLVIMVSALERMRLYVDAYGLTVLRFYSTAFMFWLALGLFWFACTALRGRSRGFVLGMVASAAAFFFVFQVMNPGGFIAQWNLDRLKDGKRFDAAYAVSLGVDAAPVLAENVEVLSGRDHETVIGALRRLHSRLKQDDWRSLTWGRVQARRALDRLFEAQARDAVARAAARRHPKKAFP
jgi:hypothetical protein